jgi:hypothetical protein
MDSGMPETGKSKADEIIEAAVNPPIAVAAESVRPGMTEGGGVGVFSFLSSSLDGGGAAVNGLAGWIHRPDLVMDRRKGMTKLVLVRRIDMIDVYR